MRLIPKLIVGVAIPGAFAVVGGAFYLEHTTDLVRDSIIDSASAQAGAAITAVDETMREYLRQWQVFADSSVTQSALADAETRYPPGEDPEAWINRIDARWKERDDPEIAAVRATLTRGIVVEEMLDHAQLTDESASTAVFGEVFLTDRRGANIAQTGDTSDFRQNDEQWWRVARDKGVYVGDIEWDDSLKDLAMSVCLRVDSPAGEFLGVMKIVMRAGAIVRFFNAITSPFDTASPSRLALVTRSGAFVCGARLSLPTNHPEIVALLAKAASAPRGIVIKEPITDNDRTRLLLIAGAPILDGAGWWAVVVERDQAALLAPVRSLRTQAALAGSIILLFILSSLTSSVLSLAGRLGALRRATLRIAAGERGVRVGLTGNDEIAALGRSLDHMAAELDDVEGQRDTYMAALESTNAQIRDQMAARHRLEDQLVQAQKLESIGQLAAGIAHEINTPMQYVADNTRFLNDAFSNVLDALNAYVEVLNPANGDKTWEERLRDVDEIAERCDLYFLREEIPKALEQSIEGIDRIASIVRAMKTFSHPGNEAKQPADINNAIESTVVVCRHRWKYVAEVELDLLPDLPNIPCNLGEFNQVILNLIVNAADAISDVVGEDGPQRGLIRIVTRRDGDHAVITVSDTGCGISDENRNRVFDPFFTTKDVGKGTGQGLALCHNTIVVRHSGSITFDSTPGKGTTFTIRLPINDPARAVHHVKDAA